ncbi:MAG: histidinol dehydrogenase [Pseudomonadota bacterium]
MALRLDAAADGFAAAFAAFLTSKREQQVDVSAVVSGIIGDVRKRGDAAILELTKRFDRQSLTADGMRVPRDEVAKVAALAPKEEVEALEFAAARISSFHATQDLPVTSYTDEAGVRLGARFTPVDAVGLYVPGGQAAYPSSVLMNAIPAQVAGVERLAMVVPTPDGYLNPLVMAAVQILGIEEIYRIGGAQAVAALAYGTDSVAPVDKIVGPGNVYVAEAKRQVFGQVGIDMVAGPSEILVVADGQNDPAWIAADLLSQAEHDADAQAILITDDPAFASSVEAAIEGHLATLPRSDIAGASWQQHGAVIVVRSLDEVPNLVDQIAPEHLELAVDDPDGLAAKIRHAGAIFLGRYTPEAVGDYVAGPNHVLPTSRSARFSSGLNVLDFVKRTTMVGCTADALRTIGPKAVTLAHAEGLQAHGLSIAIRLNLPRG